MSYNAIPFYIDEYLKGQNEISSTVLSKFLIENHGCSNKAYSTGRPKIYFQVITYLESLVSSGVLGIIKQDRNDCVYKVTNNKIENLSEIVTVEQELGSDNDQVEQQLSLF
ncbi:hypothetical protein WQ54_07895 [Bacillus sp. SA1-12]|uniref:DUF3895 domain-containing protein n=1 Tax=Bacillus sp. SA1-12 TaxID=1455638 RepID=UPI000626A81B|nr:DUF3895 domain-containing protein [Bacillus sp. SA1-12]KKI92788.1 hypothetical protein WQ54_07895 [Bacillus sp. SA1-12]